MSDKETHRNETPWRARGFKKPFSGTKNFTYQEFIDANKSNVLKHFCVPMLLIESEFLLKYLIETAETEFAVTVEDKNLKRSHSINFTIFVEG